jgi:hypothetical protein
LELINELRKVIGNKINTQKLVLFLYMSSKLPKKEIEGIIPLTIASKNSS